MIPRLLLAAAAIALALLGWSDYRDWRERQSTLEETLAEHGLDERRPEAAHDVQRQPDAERAVAVATRALLADILDPRRTRNLEPEAAAEIQDPPALLRQLRATRKLALESLERRPATWEAKLALGGSTYLIRSLERDPRIVTERDAWERPLEAARATVHGRLPASRFLSLAYLELWDALDEAERQRARELLAELFESDPRTLPQLVRPWLEVAESQEEAFAIVPDDPGAWTHLERIFSGEGAWTRAAEARRRALDALERRLGAELDEARRQLAAGRPHQARPLLAGILSEAPIDRRFAPLLEAALRDLPPGPLPARTAARVKELFTWSLELCFYGPCPLDPELLPRLGLLAEGAGPELLAQARLLAGDLASAERLERREDALWSRTWAPYLLLKSDLHRERGEPDQALAALEQVHFEWHHRPVFLARWHRLAGGEEWLVRAALAPRRHRLEDGGLVWTRAAWRMHERPPRLELLPAAAAPGIEIEIEEASREGGLIEVLWDGEVVAVEAVVLGVSLELPVEVAVRPHLLELRRVAGGGVTPGRVRLLRAPRRR